MIDCIFLYIYGKFGQGYTGCQSWFDFLRYIRENINVHKCPGSNDNEVNHT